MVNIGLAHQDDLVSFFDNETQILDLSAVEDTETNKNLIINDEGQLKIHNDAENFNIYLKQWNDNSFTYWADGYVEPIPLGKYIYISSDGENFSPTELSPNPGRDDEFIITIELQVTQQFYFYIDGTILGYSRVLNPSLPLVTSVGEEGYIAVNEDGEYVFAVSITNGVWLELIPKPIPEVNYQIQFGDGDLINMIKDEEYDPAPPELDINYVTAIYDATATNLTKDMELKVFADGEQVASSLIDVEGGDNLLTLNSEEKVIVKNDASSSTITMKVYAFGEITLFATGY